MATYKNLPHVNEEFATTKYANQIKSNFEAIVGAENLKESLTELSNRLTNTIGEFSQFNERISLLLQEFDLLKRDLDDQIDKLFLEFENAKLEIDKKINDTSDNLNELINSTGYNTNLSDYFKKLEKARNLVIAINKLHEDIGDPELLTTDNKTDTISAINELNLGVINNRKSIVNLEEKIGLVDSITDEEILNTNLSDIIKKLKELIGVFSEINEEVKDIDLISSFNNLVNEVISNKENIVSNNNLIYIINEKLLVIEPSLEENIQRVNELDQKINDITLINGKNIIIESDKSVNVDGGVVKEYLQEKQYYKNDFVWVLVFDEVSQTNINKLFKVKQDFLSSNQTSDIENYLEEVKTGGGNSNGVDKNKTINVFDNNETYDQNQLIFFIEEDESNSDNFSNIKGISALPCFYTVYPDEDGSINELKRPEAFYKNNYNIDSTWEKIQSNEESTFEIWELKSVDRVPIVYQDKLLSENTLSLQENEGGPSVSFGECVVEEYSKYLKFKFNFSVLTTFNNNVFVITQLNSDTDFSILDRFLKFEDEKERVCYISYKLKNGEREYEKEGAVLLVYSPDHNLYGFGVGFLDESSFVVGDEVTLEFRSDKFELYENESAVNKFVIPEIYIQIGYKNSNNLLEWTQEPGDYYKNIYGIDTSWSLILNDQGCTLRTEGNFYSESRESSGLQLFSQQDVWGNINTETWVSSANGIFSINSLVQGAHVGGEGKTSGADISLFRVLNSVNRGSEVRMRNFPMRIWKRS